MRQVRITLYAIMASCLVAVIQSCANGNKSGADENSVEGAKMEIVLYNDDTGSILDENKQRICGFELSGGRTGTITIRTSTDIDLFDTNTHRFYIQGNYVYAEYGDAIRDRTENGIPVKKIEQGSEIHFYLIPGADVTNTPKVTEKKEERKTETTEREVTTSTNTWTGASSMDELKQKLDGTYWHLNDRGMMRKFHFANGGVTMYSGLANRGQWTDQHSYSSYDVKMHRDTDGNNFVAVSFGGEDEKVEHRGFSMAFAKKCMIVVLFQFGNPVGQLKYGDYNWSDEL